MPTDRPPPSLATLGPTRGESGVNNQVSVTHGADSYGGSFDFPPPAHVQLLPTQFSVRWKRHCLVPAGAVATAASSATPTKPGCPRTFSANSETNAKL